MHILNFWSLRLLMQETSTSFCYWVIFYISNVVKKDLNLRKPNLCCENLDLSNQNEDNSYHTVLHLSRFFAYWKALHGNQAQQLTFLYIFPSMERLDWNVDRWNEFTGVWKGQVFCQEKRNNSRKMHWRFPGTLSLNDVLQMKLCWFRLW